MLVKKHQRFLFFCLADRDILPLGRENSEVNQMLEFCHPTDFLLNAFYIEFK